MAQLVRSSIDSIDDVHSLMNPKASKLSPKHESLQAKAPTRSQCAVIGFE